MMTTIQIDKGPTAETDERSLDEKLTALNEIFAALDGTVLIGYSGGVDSAMLAVAAHRVLGDRVIAVTADSESYAKGELEKASKIVAHFGIPHEVVRTRELDNPDYASNPVNRCYFCKSELFLHMGELAQKHHASTILYGQNIDDVGDFRPGAMAAREYGVRAPLMEAGLNKQDVRQLAKRWGVPVWNRPAMACLSSRFPYGTRVTSEGLRQVDRAELFLKELICEQLRVRHHGDVARIELPAHELSRLLDEAPRRQQINTHLRKLGYHRVTLDVLGFRSGSLNESLSDSDAPQPAPDRALADLGYTGAADVEGQILCLRLTEASLARLRSTEERTRVTSILRGKQTPYVALDLTGVTAAP